MRPVGEVRVAMRVGLHELGAGTARQLAAHTGIGLDVARYTLRDMVDAGEAVRGDPVRIDTCKRPVPVYVCPAVDGDSAVVANDEPAAWMGLAAWMRAAAGVGVEGDGDDA